MYMFDASTNENRKKKEVHQLAIVLQPQGDENVQLKKKELSSKMHVYLQTNKII